MEAEAGGGGAMAQLDLERLPGAPCAHELEQAGRSRWSGGRDVAEPGLPVHEEAALIVHPENQWSARTHVQHCPVAAHDLRVHSEVQSATLSL